MEVLLLLGLLPLLAVFAGSSDSGSDEDDEVVVEPPPEERNRIEGNEDADELYGVDDNDEDIVTFAGNDFANGRGGEDLLDMGEGDDAGSGGADNDTVYGGSGADTLIGGTGDDRVFLGTGDDRSTPTVSPVDDLAAGDDLIRGGFGNDTLFDDSGADTLYGDAGADVLLADSPEDRDDLSDLLFGGFGDDTIIGNDGDTMTGGADGDTFVNFTQSAEEDGPIWITDFNEAEDQLVLEWDVDALGPADVSDLSFQPDEEADLLEIYIHDQLVAVLQGVTSIDPATLTLNRITSVAA